MEDMSLHEHHSGGLRPGWSRIVLAGRTSLTSPTERSNRITPGTPEYELRQRANLAIRGELEPPTESNLINNRHVADA